MHTHGATLGKVTKVELLGNGIATELPFTQDEIGLNVTPPASVQAFPGINNSTLASSFRVLRITQDKGWTNDDDPGVTMAQGWFRHSNLNAGDFNNDLTTSETPGAIWSFTFTGTGVTLIAPKERGRKN